MTYLRILLLLFLPIAASAQSGAIHLLLSNDSTVFERVASELELQLATVDSPLNIQRHSTDENIQHYLTPDDLVVAIGNEAADNIIQLGLNTPVIYSVIDKQILVTQLSESHQSPPWSAIVIDQPLQRSVSIADTLIEQQYKNKIVIVVSQTNTTMINEIAALAPLNNGVIDIVRVTSNDLAAKIIDDSLFNAAALIAIHDEEIWSGKSAQLLLRQAYNYGVPVIGYSKKFLKAGALIAVTSSIKDMVQNTATQIEHWSVHRVLSKQGIVYSKATIDINQHIARALRISLPDFSSQEEVNH